LCRNDAKENLNKQSLKKRGSSGYEDFFSAAFLPREALMIVSYPCGTAVHSHPINRFEKVTSRGIGGSPKGKQKQVRSAAIAEHAMFFDPAFAVIAAWDP
jgi:hypothetical protein